MNVDVCIKRGFIMGVLAFALIPSETLAHGYVMKPESRSYACKLNKNAQCGTIIYEPQSLEGGNNFPQAGPADGKIASAGLSQFAQLNQQSPTRWSKSNITNGSYDFVWYNTTMHATKSWRYFITKNGWNPNVPLARSAFELTPFCLVNGYGRQPASQVTHRCQIPGDRSGHHVILAIWDVADTVNAFYNTIDVNIGSSTSVPPSTAVPTIWTDIGDINPIDDLNINDRVKTRVFDENGENSRLHTEIIIRSIEQGARQIWPRLLAEAINKQHTALRAGIQNSQGQIIPSNGKNDVFTSAQSGIRRVEIKLERAIENITEPPVSPQPPTQPPVTPQPPTEVPIPPTQPPVSPQPPTEVPIPPTQPPVSPQPPTEIPTPPTQPPVTPQPPTEVPTPPTQPPVTPQPPTEVPTPPTQPPVSPQPPTEVPIPPTQPSSTYHYVYPENIAKYKAGTRVLGSDGQVYQCKRFPYSGWCTIPAHQYVPATGSHWQDAWILVK